MDGLILLLALVLGVWMLNLNGRIKMLENRLADALDLLTSGKRPETTAPAAEPDLAETPAAVKPAVAYASRRPTTLRSEAKSAPPPIAADEELPSTVDSVEFPQRSASWSFEELVGGKLPIWIGGIALVFAGFFLVRYTIDAGLLGPGTRSVLATIFALLLIAGSQWGGRLPKIGESFTADPRIAQSLAGAGIATLFGTLYMAAEIYGLIGVPVAFALLIATTVLAFALALRHGPPTALMGLVGGFTAPWVAGLGPDNVPVLLLYLGVFLAGLFGLALWRRWLWLLLLASGGGALWTIGLVVTANDSLPLIGMFVMIAGGAAVLVGDRFAEDDPRLAAVARFAPMGIALLQLAMLLPRLEFSSIGWGFYAALSAAAIGLAWRDDRHLPNIFGALLLCLMPLATGWGSQAGHSMMILASVGTGLLFGIPGHLRAASSAVSRSYWALLALLAQALPFFTAFSLAKSEFSDFAWGGVAALLIVPAGYIAWQWRSAESYIDRIVRIASAGLAALMGWIALTHWFSNDYLASATFVVTAALAAWAMRTQSKAMQELAVIPLAFGVLALATGSLRFFEALNNSLGGIKLMASTPPRNWGGGTDDVAPRNAGGTHCRPAPFRSRPLAAPTGMGRGWSGCTQFPMADRQAGRGDRQPLAIHHARPCRTGGHDPVAVSGRLVSVASRNRLVEHIGKGGNGRDRARAVPHVLVRSGRLQPAVRSANAGADTGRQSGHGPFGIDGILAMANGAQPRRRLGAWATAQIVRDCQSGDDGADRLGHGAPIGAWQSDFGWWHRNRGKLPLFGGIAYPFDHLDDDWYPHGPCRSPPCRAGVIDRGHAQSIPDRCCRIGGRASHPVVHGAGHRADRNWLGLWQGYAGRKSCGGISPCLTPETP